MDSVSPKLENDTKPFWKFNINNKFKIETIYLMQMYKNIDSNKLSKNLKVKTIEIINY